MQTLDNLYNSIIHVDVATSIFKTIEMRYVESLLAVFRFCFKFKLLCSWNQESILLFTIIFIEFEFIFIYCYHSFQLTFTYKSTNFHWNILSFQIYVFLLKNGILTSIFKIPRHWSYSDLKAPNRHSSVVIAPAHLSPARISGVELRIMRPVSYP